MAWNEPGDDQNKQDPWNKRKNAEQGPPDLDKMIKNVINSFKKQFKENKPSMGPGSGSEPPMPAKILAVGIAFVAVAIFVVWVIAGIFIVQPAEQAVVLRFGKYEGTYGPGPHWIPRFIDTYYKVNTQKVNSFAFSADFLTKSTGDADKPKQIVKVSDVTDDQDVVQSTTGADDTDKNVVDVELSIQYRINKPELYLFNIVNGGATLEQVSKSVLSQVIGTMQLSDVLTVGRDQLALDVSKQAQDLMDAYQSGIEVVTANVRKAQAPEEVRDAFLDVVQAGQDEQRFIQQAQAYASKVVPIAEGNAKRTLADAEAYRQKVVLNAQGNIASYNAILGVYKTSPGVTRERLYLDTIQSVLENTSKLLIDSDNSNNLLYLPIDKLMAASSKTSKTEESSTQSLSPDDVAALDEKADQVPDGGADFYSNLYRSRESAANTQTR